MRFLVWLASSPWFLLGVACYAISIFLWLAVLSKTEVSLAYPLSSVGFILTALVGYLFLNETIDLPRVAGIGLICAGILVLSQST